MSRPQTVPEERLNAWTHGVGALFGVVGLGMAVVHGSTTSVGAGLVLGVYALSVTLLFGVSALYHLVPAGPWKRRLQKADHCAIYGLIAGTYTPFALLALGGWAGWGLFAGVWTLAVAGVLMELTREERAERVALALYLVMGWSALTVAVPLVNALPMAAAALIVAGGVLYTGGIWFYTRDRPWDHGLWHGFVLGGAAAHGLAVALTV